MLNANFSRLQKSVFRIQRILQSDYCNESKSLLLCFAYQEAWFEERLLCDLQNYDDRKSGLSRKIWIRWMIILNSSFVIGMTASRGWRIKARALRCGSVSQNFLQSDRPR